MNPYPSLPSHLLSRVQWLKVQMSQHLDAAGVDRWRKRLQLYLSANHMQAAIAPGRIAVMPLARGLPLTGYDRGLVVGWLIAQPEVAFVHVERDKPLPQGVELVLNLEQAHG